MSDNGCGKIYLLASEIATGGDLAQMVTTRGSRSVREIVNIFLATICEVAFLYPPNLTR